MSSRGGAAAACALALACGARQKVETTAAKTLISPAQSEQIGVQVQQQLRAQGVHFIDDPAIDGYVEQVAAPLLDIARKARPDIGTWKIRVIDDPKTVNAFATGGGDLYVYSGLLLAVRNGAELAGVLAHEMGHVVLYHVERQLVDTYGLQALAELALGQNTGVATQLAAGVAAKGALLAHSRASESEADRWAVVQVDRAGYDPHGLASFFETLLGQEGRTPMLLSWLSDHPTTRSRIDEVQKLIREDRLDGGGDGPPGLAQAQARIRAPPQASAAKPAP